MVVMAEWPGDASSRSVRTVEGLVVSFTVAHLWPRQHQGNESKEGKVHDGHVV